MTTSAETTQDCKHREYGTDDYKGNIIDNFHLFLTSTSLVLQKSSGQAKGLTLMFTNY